jgi:RNA polymerase sigma-70 factor (ECF subfamily)
MVASAATIDGFSGAPSLVRRCVSGELTAWRDLHRRYQPAAVAFLRKLGVRDRDVDDVCQEVFLQVFRNLSQFREEAELKTWMYRICASQASRYHRRWKVLSRLRDAFAPGAVEPSVPANDAGALDARRGLDRALSRMNEGERLVFVLFELEGVPGSEVAEIAGCPLNTVWRRLHDGRRKLREALGLGPDEELG